MADDKKKKKRKITPLKVLKIFIILILILGIIGGGAVFGIVLSIIKEAPDIDPTTINASLDQTSFIYDIDGNLIEKIQAPELRTFVSLGKMPKHLKDAFIAIEDERFEKHIGVDPKGILAAAVSNFKAGEIVRGGSTITQQLIKNVYLSDEATDKKMSRKIKEAYLAIQMERVLHKDQILEAYLNRISLGQNAYGVQEAAQTYFSKDVGDLTIAESALIAGIVKSTTNYQPYIRVKPENFDENKQFEVGRIDVLGEKYVLVYNPKSVERQKLVLNNMLRLGFITEGEYEQALRQDIKTSLKPAERKLEGISSYFTDYVKTQVTDALVEKLGYTKERAQDELFSGGLKIYTTIDVKLQKELEDVYNNFTEILVGNTENIKGPVLVDWRLSKAGNVIDDKNNIIYYSQANLLNEDFGLIIEKDTYEISEGNIIIKNKNFLHIQNT